VRPQELYMGEEGEGEDPFDIPAEPNDAAAGEE
jgi:hypothetical protein